MLGTIMLATFMVAIEGTIVATAMARIVEKLGGLALYSWVFSAFLLTQAATTVLFGKLADLYGRRPVLIVGIVIFLVGSTLCGFAWSMPSLIVFRLIQGLGAGSILPVATTVIGDIYTMQERARVQGYLASVWGISAVIGPLAGGIIVEHLSWHWIFWINVPIGIGTIFGLMLYLHENVEHKKHSLDVLGAVLFAVGISALLLVLTQLGQPGGFSTAALIYGGVFIACVPLFLWQERRAKEPMVVMSIWSEPVIASSNATVLLAGMSLMGITAYLPVYVQGVLGRSPMIAGFALTSLAVGWPIASILARSLYPRIGMRGTLRLGSVFIIAGSTVLMLLSTNSTPVMAGIGSGIVGFGMGLLNVTVILLVQGSVGWAQRGSATAANIFARNIGSTLGAAVLGSVLNFVLMRQPGMDAEAVRQLLDQAGGASVHRDALQAGLHATFWVALGLALLTGGVSLIIPDRKLHELSGGEIQK